MSNFIVICALEEEFKSDVHSVVYSGVGKVNAAIATMSVIHRVKPDLIINVGTCGSRKHKGLVECGVFSDRDLINGFNAETFVTNSDLIHCSTGDRFLEDFNGDEVADMEAYAIARVCRDYNTKFLCYKYVTDDGEQNDWKSRIGDGQNNFSLLLDRINE
jgi:adenosylhomocysteine nucleosidase